MDDRNFSSFEKTKAFNQIMICVQWCPVPTEIVTVISSFSPNTSAEFHRRLTTNYNKQRRRKKKNVTRHKGSMMGREQDGEFCIHWRSCRLNRWEVMGTGSRMFFLDCFSFLSYLSSFTNARKIPGRSILNRDSLSPNRNRAIRRVPVRKCHGWQ